MVCSVRDITLQYTSYGREAFLSTKLSGIFLQSYFHCVDSTKVISVTVFDDLLEG